MREILFRGQTRKKGEKVRLDGSPVDGNWVFGGVNQGEGDFSIIYQMEPEIHKYPVYTDTLGQYTGLTDKNGKRIFEGDIVRFRTKTSAFKSLYVRWHEETARFVASNQNGFRYYPMDRTWDYEIIGNIHDNPELIKDGEQNA